MTEKEIECARDLIEEIDSGRSFIPLEDPCTRGVLLRAVRREYLEHADNYRAEYLYEMLATLPHPALMYGFELETARNALMRILDEIDG